MTDGQRYPSVSCQRSCSVKLRAADHFVRQNITVNLLDSVKVLRVELTRQHEEAPGLDQQAEVVPLLERFLLVRLSKRFVKVQEGVRTKRDCGYGRVKQWPVHMGHNALSRQVLVEQNVVCFFALWKD